MILRVTASPLLQGRSKLHQPFPWCSLLNLLRQLSCTGWHLAGRGAKMLLTSYPTHLYRKGSSSLAVTASMWVACAGKSEALFSPFLLYMRIQLGSRLSPWLLCFPRDFWRISPLDNFIYNTDLSLPSFHSRDTTDFWLDLKNSRTIITHWSSSLHSRKEF